MILCLTVHSFIDKNNIKTSSNNINLQKVNVKPYGCNKVYLNKDLIEDKPCQLIDEFNEIKTNEWDFYFVLPDSRYPFYNENRRTYKILFVRGPCIGYVPVVQPYQIVPLSR